MTVRTLAEAAAEVLNKTRSSAPAEPMHTMPHQVVDLGGATHENPEGTNVGLEASKARGVATPPGVKPDASTNEPMHKLKPQAQDTEVHPAHVSPEEENGEGVDTAGHEYTHPTIGEETSEEISDETEMSAEELEEAKKAKHEWMKKKVSEMGSCKEDIDALFNGEDLSEEFKQKVTAIFEGAVIARAVSVAEELETEILAAAEESVEEIKNELEEQVDAYLNYMVEEWVNENQVAIESGLKAEIAEEFIAGLKNLFTEHYIEVPEEKLDVVEAMAEEVDELKSKLNEALNQNIELARAIVEAKKTELVTSVCEGLTATQAEKVKALAESVEFTTESEYVGRVKIIRENYFKTEPLKVKEATKQVQLSESTEAVVPEETSSSMDRYVQAISRTLP